MISGTVVGNLGRDAETKQVGDNEVTSFSIASSERKKGEEVTTWVTVNLWGKRFAGVVPYLTKGTQVAVAGSFSQRKYQAKDGTDRVDLECNGNDLKLLGSKDKSTTNGAKPTSKPQHVSDPGWGNGGDDIPF